MISVAALRKTSNENARRLAERLAKRDVRILFDGYAPRIWLVSFKGTASQLANLIWPVGTPEQNSLVSEGMVIRIPHGKYVNGYASKEMWDLFDGG